MMRRCSEVSLHFFDFLTIFVAKDDSKFARTSQISNDFSSVKDWSGVQDQCLTGGNPKGHYYNVPKTGIERIPPF